MLSFDDMLSHISGRSDALRAAAVVADFDARVPCCPDWSVRDLIAHVGEVQLFWSAAVAAGPADSPPSDDAVGDVKPHGDMLAWSATATATLVAALRDAGPERGCWTWWKSAGAPMTAQAVARHQVQEAAIHALDAQQAAGLGSSLPPSVAADGVGEHLTVELPTNGPWPHDPARLLIEAGDGGTWLIALGQDGALVSKQPDGTVLSAEAVVSGSPNDLVLAFYRRQDLERLQVVGDERLLSRLLTWPNLD